MLQVSNQNFIVNRIRERQVVSSVKKHRKMFFFLSQAWDKEKILSPSKESNFRPSDSVLRCSTTKPQRLYGEEGLLQSSYDTHPAYY